MSKRLPESMQQYSVHGLSGETLQSTVDNQAVQGVATTGEKLSGGTDQAVNYRLVKGMGESASVLVYLMAFGDSPRLAYDYHGAVLSLLLRDGISGSSPSVLIMSNIGVGALPGDHTKNYNRNNKLTNKQREALYHGDFERNAGAIAVAAASALEEHDLSGRDAYVVGPSLGASLAAAGISQFGQEFGSLKGVAMLDPVGLSPAKPLVRGAQFAYASAGAGPYLALNHPLHQEADKGLGLSAMGNMLNTASLFNALAISRGRTDRDLLREADYMRRHGVLMDLRVGEKSEFNIAKATGRMVELLKQKGVDAEGLVIPSATHGLTVSSGLQGATVKSLMDRRN